MTRSTPPAVTNVQVQCHLHNCAGFINLRHAWLSWECDGARYHIHFHGELTPALEIEDGATLYKNPLVERGHPEHYDPRKLDPTAKANAAMLAEALRIARSTKLAEREIERHHAHDRKLQAEANRRAALSEAVLAAGADVSRGSGRQPTYSELLAALAWHHNRGDYHSDEQGQRFKHAIRCLIDNAAGETPYLESED